jgi:microtubule-associated protein-like 6
MRDGNNATEMEGFEVEDVGGGDQFMAVKPWIGVIKNSVPSKYKPSPRDSEAPDATLQLEYIHGYRCHDARNNLRYTATGEIVFHAAAVGIVLNQKTNT